MDDLFISYKREERDKARQLADALESRGWSVWWDPKLRAGEHFDDVIEQTIRNVKCVIVLWSKLAIASRYIKDEANYALKLQKLVPVTLDEAEPPFRFQGLHTIALRAWDGSVLSPAFQELEKTIEAKAGRPVAGTKTIFDLLKRLKPPEPPEPASLSAAEIGVNPRELMELHCMVRNRAASLERLLPSLPDWPSKEPAYGRITRTELSDFTRHTSAAHTGPRLERKVFNRRLEFARKVLKEMELRGIEAVDCMPAQLKNIPAHLRKRAIDILLYDPLAGASVGIGHPFEITPENLGTYRLLNRSAEVVHDVEQIADHLGWRIQ